MRDQPVTGLLAEDRGVTKPAGCFLAAFFEGAGDMEQTVDHGQVTAGRYGFFSYFIFYGELERGQGPTLVGLNDLVAAPESKLGRAVIDDNVRIVEARETIDISDSISLCDFSDPGLDLGLPSIDVSRLNSSG